MKTILIFSTLTGKDHRELINGIRSFADRIDWNLQVQTFNGRAFPVTDLIRFWHPAGCIVAGNGSDVTRETLPCRALLRTPTVYIGRNPLVVPKHATCVIHNAVSAASLAARELLTFNIDSFAFVGQNDATWSRRRQVAFTEVMALNGKSVQTFNLDSDEARSEIRELTRLERWLAALPKPCGLFAANDSHAETILSVCRRAKISVPDDIAVIGVDNDESICERTTPTLSSIRADFQQCGRFAARLLARKILSSRPVPEETLFGTMGIVRRGSTRRMLRRDSEVSAALGLIHAPGGVLMSARDILAQFSCSRRNAELRFRLATGKSILDEILSARIELAKSLLAETHLSITDIAVQCGYRHPAHFRDRFRAATGINPLAWRKRS